LIIFVRKVLEMLEATSFVLQILQVTPSVPPT
jgi:hypothetical protein